MPGIKQPEQSLLGLLHAILTVVRSPCFIRRLPGRHRCLPTRKRRLRGPALEPHATKGRIWVLREGSSEQGVNPVMVEVRYTAG